MAVRTSATSGLWNASDADTWGLGAGVYPHPSNDDVVIANGHTVTLSGGSACKSLEVQSGGIFDGDGNTMEIAGEASSGNAVNIDGGISGTDTDFDIRTAATTALDLNASSGNIRNLTINHASCNALLSAAASITGNLTITAGTLDTDSSGNQALTVTGDVSVTGTLTGNASAISMGSLTIAAAGTYSATSGTTTITSETGAGYAIFNTANGTFTHNSGTVHISMTSKNTLIFGMEGDDTSGTGANAFNNLTVTLSTDNRLELDPAAGNAHVIKGDVTIVEGHFKPDSTGHSLTIEGDVSIESGGTIGATNRTGDHTFGSLTIASGGTYIATSGTTTITGENSGGFAIQNSGTFTHNKGLVDIDFTSPTTTMASNGPYWDFTQSDAATDFYTEAVFEVMNNLYFVGDFDFQNNSHHLIVHGNMTIGNGTTTTRYMPYGTYTCNLTVHGILEVTNGATLTNFTHGTINVGGVRNTGGTM